MSAYVYAGGWTIAIALIFVSALALYLPFALLSPVFMILSEATRYLYRPNLNI